MEKCILAFGNVCIRSILKISLQDRVTNIFLNVSEYFRNMLSTSAKSRVGEKECEQNTPSDESATKTCRVLSCRYSHSGRRTSLVLLHLETSGEFSLMSYTPYLTMEELRSKVR